MEVATSIAMFLYNLMPPMHCLQFLLLFIPKPEKTFSHIPVAILCLKNLIILVIFDEVHMCVTMCGYNLFMRTLQGTEKANSLGARISCELPEWVLAIELRSSARGMLAHNCCMPV